MLVIRGKSAAGLRMMVPVLLNDHPRNFVVDTGFRVSVLSTPVPGVNIRPPSRRTLNIYRGDSLSIVGEQNLKADINGHCRIHVFLLVDPSTDRLDYDILGLDLMKTLPIKLLPSSCRVEIPRGDSLPQVVNPCDGFAIEPSPPKELPEAIRAEIRSRLLHLSRDNQVQVMGIFQKYSTLFAPLDFHGAQLGIVFSIDTGTARPIDQQPSEVPHALQPAAQDLLADLLANGIIMLSDSPWSSPVELVKKKNLPGEDKVTYQLRHNYGELNRITKSGGRPLCDYWEQLEHSDFNSRLFSTIYLKESNHQIPMHHLSQQKTAFTLLGQHYEYRRMPFGLKNAVVTFQSAMDDLFVDMMGDYCVVYIDEILVYGKDLPNHLENLDLVLDRLSSANLRIDLKKCEFFKEEITYLSHVVSAEGVRKDPNLVSEIQHYPTPTCVTQLRDCLRLAAFYRHFIPNFSRLIAPFIPLLKQETPYVWTDELQGAMNALKDAVKEERTIPYPNLDRDFNLVSFASSRELDPILSLECDEDERPATKS